MIDAMLKGSMNMVNRRKAAEIYPFLEAYIAKREQQIAEIEQMVQRYEKKRLVEESAYRSMSPFRRMLAGKKPDHHLAVEYIHYVKKPMEQVRRLRSEAEEARKILSETKPNDDIELTEQMQNELI